MIPKPFQLFTIVFLYLKLPATSAIEERNLSSLQGLKTWMLMTRIFEERLNELALLNCYRHVSINYEEIIDEI